MSSEPGVKFDVGKLRWRLFPWLGAEWVQRVIDYGANKYSEHGWQTVPDASKRYTDALFRHLIAAQCGELLDPESGLPHLAHVATNALFLLHFMTAGDPGV